MGGLGRKIINSRVKLSSRCRVSCKVEIPPFKLEKKKRKRRTIETRVSALGQETAHPFCQPEKGLKFGNFPAGLLGLSFVSIVHHGDIWLEGSAESSSHPWNE